MSISSSKIGRPRTTNPRNKVLEVYLSNQEYETLKNTSRDLGYDYLSQFMRHLLLDLHKRKLPNINAKVQIVLAHLGAIQHSADLLSHIFFKPGMPEEARSLSNDLRIQIKNLNQTITSQTKSNNNDF